MKKKFHLYSGTLVLGLLLLCSCSADFLNITPNEQLSDESVFADKSGGDLFLNDVYNNLPDHETINAAAYDSFECFGDNAVDKFTWSVTWNMGISRNYGPSAGSLYNHGFPAIPFHYPTIFAKIRKCNVFIKNVEDKIGNFPEEWTTTRLAEARFLRAYFYHLAWMAYGGLPIIKSPLDRNTQGDKIFYPRSTFSETFDFITGELGECAADLPNEVGNGRATRGAALTLKGWCEMFARRYDLAAVTNKQVMDLGVYDLFPNYNGQFFEQNNNNVESIFAYQHVPGNKTSQRSMLFGPMGEYNGWGCMQPTQNLVDDYRMKNGLPITDPNSGYVDQDPYANREDRFYQSIIYNNTVFSGKSYPMHELYNPAIDAQTGYQRRKGIMEPLNLGQEGYNFIYFRFAEVLLSYAEAKIELDQIDESVLTAINRVRVRGILPTLQDTYGKATFSQDELRTIVRNERRIELAFEVKRYWDLIRWRTAEVVLNQPIMGINYENGRYVRKEVHSMSFDASKHYLFPMDQSWIDLNPEWKKQNNAEFKNGQNPGY